MINIRELHHNYKEYADKEVTIGGWLKSKRDSKTDRKSTRLNSSHQQ